MRLPDGYNKALQRLDPLLRMRWSDARQMWRLERKWRRPNVTDAPRYDLPPDTVIMRRDGYMLLSEYAPRELPNIDRLISCLQWSDTWNMGFEGGLDKVAQQLADAMDAYDSASQEAACRRAVLRAGDAFADVFIDGQYMDGERVAFGGVKPFEERA